MPPPIKLKAPPTVVGGLAVNQRCFGGYSTAGVAVRPTRTATSSTGPCFPGDSGMPVVGTGRTAML